MAADADPPDLLGSYIRAQRQLADLTLRQVAEMTSISNAYLSQVERGLHQPSLRVLRQIAEALQISRAELLKRTGLSDPGAAGDQPRSNTEAAIEADPSLAEEDREMLVQLYRKLRRDTNGQSDD